MAKKLEFGSFLLLGPKRDKKIAQADETASLPSPNINALARQMHPNHLTLRLDKIIPDGNNGYTYRLVSLDGSPLPYFAPGAYVSAFLNGPDSLSRPYTLSSSPLQAKEGVYELSIRHMEGGAFTSKLDEYWKAGTIVCVSAPKGQFRFDPLRDAHHVISIAGGSGVTPFLSMAKAIVEGSAHFDLTLIYAYNHKVPKRYLDVLLSLEAKSENVKIIPVCEEIDGFVQLSHICSAYKERPTSLFFCGNAAMRRHIKTSLSDLSFAPRSVRFEVQGDLPLNKEIQSHQCTVHLLGETRVITIPEGYTVLRGLEENGIYAPSSCRSGTCGLCLARLLDGQILVPEERDHRLEADKSIGFFHPCSSYALSDLELEIYPAEKITFSWAL